MPVYEYECSKGHVFTERQSIHSDPLSVCKRKKCRASCKRLIFPVNFHLSGTGWARDGYSNSGGKKKDK